MPRSTWGQARVKNTHCATELTQLGRAGPDRRSGSRVHTRSSRMLFRAASNGVPTCEMLLLAPYRGHRAQATLVHCWTSLAMTAAPAAEPPSPHNVQVADNTQIQEILKETRLPPTTKSVSAASPPASPAGLWWAGKGQAFLSCPVGGRMRPLWGAVGLMRGPNE